MHRIGQLAKRFGLSRSTLLYYHRIGLLPSASRSDSNYRLYSDEDLIRLEKICTYREAGLSLKSILEILESSSSTCTEVLEQRLEKLNAEISDLRNQQRLVLSLLDGHSLLRATKTMSKDQWVKILRASGMDESAMHQWHCEFELALPEVHADFLESLGIDAEEITSIREWSRSANAAPD